MNLFRCVLASLYEVVSVRPSVGPSVRPLVGRLVTLSSKTRLIDIFEQIIATGGLLGSLDASLHLYKTVYPSIGLSVHWSVCHASVNVFQQVKERESQEESHVVTSSHNHFIIMRTHRWPYGPCSAAPVHITMILDGRWILGTLINLYPYARVPHLEICNTLTFWNITVFPSLVLLHCIAPWS